MDKQNVTLLRVTDKTKEQSNGNAVYLNRNKMDESDVEEPAKEITKIEDQSVLGRIKRFFKSAFKIIKSLFGLIFLLVVYTLLGAAIFMITEGTEEDGQKEGIETKRENVITILLNLSNKFVNSEEFKNKSRNILIEYEDTVRNTDYSSTGQQVWSFWGSMFFCGTVYTTIGYGNYAPKTQIGKLLAILYACIGIPLALIVFAELGKRFTVGVKFVWAFARRYYYTGYCRKIIKRSNVSHDITTIENGASHKHKSKYSIKSETEVEGIALDKNGDGTRSEDSKDTGKVLYGVKIDTEFNLPMTVAIVIMILYIVVGAAMYTIWENWTFADSFYFVFISISTIGFGDILPEHPKYFILSFIYIFIGLSLVSMCINVAIEFFTKTIDRAKVKMDKAKDRVAEVSKEKMERVGKQIDKTKERAREQYDKTRERAREQIDKTREMAKEKVTGAGKNVKSRVTEVRKNIGENIHKEIEKMKKHSIDSQASLDSNGRKSKSSTPTIEIPASMDSNGRKSKSSTPTLDKKTDSQRV